MKSGTGSKKAHVIALGNVKGGVGKTTATMQLAHTLGREGKKVLVVDCDPQANASMALAMTHGVPDFPRSLAQLLLVAGNEQCIFDVSSTRESIVGTRFVNVDLLPTDIRLARAATQLWMHSQRFMPLREVLAPVLGDYDYILLDTPASVESVLTGNALTAADWLLVVTRAEFYAVMSTDLYDGYVREKIQRTNNPGLKFLGVFVAQYAKGHSATEDSLRGLRQRWEGQLLAPMVPRSTVFEKSLMAGESVIEFAQSSEQADAYRALGRLVIERCNGGKAR